MRGQLLMDSHIRQSFCTLALNDTKFIMLQRLLECENGENPIAMSSQTQMWENKLICTLFTSIHKHECTS